MRTDGRKNDQLRPIRMTPDYISHAEGSLLIEWGNTRVVSTVTVEEKVPSFLRGTQSGWITAEYGMLPRSTQVRMQRESTRGKAGGRTLEIQRLIGRSLRGVVDLKELGERTLWVDCDVIQADGGTRVSLDHSLFCGPLYGPGQTAGHEKDLISSGQPVCGCCECGDRRGHPCPGSLL